MVISAMGIHAKVMKVLALRQLALSIVAVISAGLWTSLQAATVEGMRLWAAPDHARLVFDLSGATSADVFSLDDPARLVIDLENSQLEADPDSLSLEDSAISALRTGTREGNGLRVVLELNREVEPRHFTLTPNDQYGHRLVVDLEYPGESAVENPIDPIEAMIREQEIQAQRAGVQVRAGSDQQATEIGRAHV